MQRTTQLHNLSLLSVLQYFSKIMPTQQKRKIMPLSFKNFTTTVTVKNAKSIC